MTACQARPQDREDVAPQLAPHFDVTPQQAKLYAAGGTTAGLFGAAVAMSGDTAVIGASRDAQHGDGAGAAYVFVRTGARWVQQAKLVAADGAANDNFGVAVAISGDTLVVGAMFNDERDSDAGAAYVFT
ncbi:MAG TPA: FG-GAP repeat protein, partial [Kofleriaceae bacterium]